MSWALRLCLWAMASFAAVAGSGHPERAAALLQEVSVDIEAGRWREASALINEALSSHPHDLVGQQAFRFQQDRMRRIRLDFPWTRDATFARARSILPGLTPELFDQWEAEGGVESFEIDGERWYFNRAAENLFRIHPGAKALKASLENVDASPETSRQRAIRGIIRESQKAGRASVLPKRFRVTYTLTVKPAMVPAGETIRAWLPYPHRGTRQTDIVLLRSTPDWHILSPPAHPLSSIYLEQASRGSQTTPFTVVFEYTTTASCQPVHALQSANGATVVQSNLDPHLQERPPHLVFDEALRRLSDTIVADATRPEVVVRKLFGWISGNIPWAGAREYSTLDSLTRYALANRHGDCGIQTLLLMSLCRLNRIPARWESGWITGSRPDLHDWCSVYLEPLGWVPVDVSFGLQPGADQNERWFYLGGLDADRLVVNTDHEQPLYPAKIFFRSESVDFQRGEVEWRGGNLYFDQWTYDFSVEERPLNPNPAGPDREATFMECSDAPLQPPVAEPAPRSGDVP